MFSVGGGLGQAWRGEVGRGAELRRYRRDQGRPPRRFKMSFRIAGEKTQRSGERAAARAWEGGGEGGAAVQCLSPRQSLLFNIIIKDL